MYGYSYYPNYTQQTTQDERIWVSSKQAGEAYLVAPNGFARLWDSSTNRFYEKRADATGRPLPMEVYEYTRVAPYIDDITDEANKLSFEDINAKFDAITQRIDALENAKKGATDNGTKSYANDTSL